MRIDVLNGVNLNLLGRRDPATYGGQSIQDLETQIYAWARELDLQVRCRQTGPRGGVRRLPPPGPRLGGRPDRQPRRLDALLVGDPRRARAVRRYRSSRCTCSNVDEREEWRRHSVLTGLGGMRIVGQGIRRVPRGALQLLEREAPWMTRLERLGGRASTMPLLVTYGVNVRYLTGFDSSNCALLVEPGGATTLYTDFRYLEAAKAVDGVEVVQTPAGRRRRARRAARRDAHRLRGGTRLDLRAVGDARAPAAPTSCRPVVRSRRCVRSRTRTRSQRSAVLRAISDAVYAALAQERLAGRTEADVAWWIERAFRERGAEAPLLRADRRVGRERLEAARRRGRHRHRRLGRSSRSTWAASSTATAPTARGRSRPASCRRSCRGLRSSSREAQLAGLAAVRAGAHGRDVDAASRIGIEAAGLCEAYGHGLGHGVGLEVHEAPVAAAGVDRRPRAGKRRHGRAGPLPPGCRRLPHRGPRRRHRGRLRDPDALHERAADALVGGVHDVHRAGTLPAAWPRSSTRTSSRTGCTSSTAARCGASSSSST